MKVNKLDKQGKLTKDKVEIKSILFDREPNKELLDQYIYIYLSNQRRAGAKTKDRGEVSGGGKKPWKQKGTGRARVGSNRSPIWRGGGITFGPTGLENYKKKLSKKMKTRAFVSALKLMNDKKALYIGVKPDVNKTSDAVDYIENSGFKTKGITFVHKNSPELLKTMNNLKGVKVIDVRDLNAYDVAISSHVVIMEEALDIIDQRLNKTVENN